MDVSCIWDKLNKLYLMEKSLVDRLSYLHKEFFITKKELEKAQRESQRLNRKLKGDS